MMSTKQRALRGGCHAHVFMEVAANMEVWKRTGNRENREAPREQRDTEVVVEQRKGDEHGEQRDTKRTKRHRENRETPRDTERTERHRGDCPNRGPRQRRRTWRTGYIEGDEYSQNG